MRRFPLVPALLLLVVALFTNCASPLAANTPPEQQPAPGIEGRWDITIYDDGKVYPSWLEVFHSGTKRLIGHYVGISGSARPISKINFKDGKMSFIIPPQWEEEDNDLSFEASLQGDSLAGTLVAANGKSYKWSGRRAPSLHRDKDVVWGTPMQLFNGKNLDGWRAMGDNQWVVESGVLKSPRSGANLVTEKTFNDFKLHAEFRCPKGSNSGLYLRGRYEVQIEDSKGKDPQKDLLGAVYGFIKPSDMPAKDAGEWQTYDITLVGRMVTIVLNGKQVVCNQEIPGITGGALDSREGEPGPIMIQGDHGPIEFRKITITPGR
ncbi:DUF1080 domain-containing protein [Flavihumibacter sp. ZG627]|uniref:3-keto-disaccharide hydrolase n=1 Tax=Flavihumibacter sp. ZG627 TaxID=1463156 RepID=UPI00057D72B3|nr:DUF1080 domain-containing protein [Flavihumibacter sp. ZG627]KIC91357.1 large multifunctional protein- glycosyl hydrolase [Flavihumibacter sp. ZG627]